MESSQNNSFFSKFEKIGRDIYRYPTDPTKLLRHELVSPEDAESLYAFESHISDLEERFDIPTVHPSFDASSAPASRLGHKSDVDILAVVDDISDGKTYEDCVSSQEIKNPEVLVEYVGLIDKLALHLHDVYRNGGEFCAEFYHLHQYLYSESQPRGERLILVDVDMLGFRQLPAPHSRLAGGVPIGLLDTISELIEEFANLRKQSETEDIVLPSLVGLVEDFDDAGIQAVAEVKLRLLALLTKGETEHSERIREYFDYGEEEIPILHEIRDIDQCVSMPRHLVRDGVI